MRKNIRAGKSAAPKVKHRSQGGEIWHRLTKSKTAMISLGFIVLLVCAVVFAPILTPYDFAGIDLRSSLQFPSWQHIMGTDQYGRDLFTRLLFGGRISLLVALTATAMSIVVGGLIGAAAGYFGGWFDTVAMRIMDVFMAIPGLLMAITVAAALGTGIFNTAIAVAISNIPSLSRIMRSSVLLLREQEYVEAATAFGASDARIIRKHVIPNTLAPLIVQATLSIGNAILAIAGLSFIGLGIAPPTPEWGSILSNSMDQIMSFWPLIIFPGLMIALTMLAFNLLGDGLRDAMDPRLKQ